MPQWVGETRRWVNANKLLTLGILGTAGYVALLWHLIGHKLNKFEALELNAVGDFFAGIFGPLTVGWLILGYLQQGLELKQNSRALRLQADELKNSVEQQSKLAQATFEQLELEREKMRAEREASVLATAPRLILEDGSMQNGRGKNGEHLIVWHYVIRNYGHECHNVRLELKGTDFLELDGSTSTPLLERMAAMEVELVADFFGGTTPVHAALIVSYTTLLGTSMVDEYEVERLGLNAKIVRRGESGALSS